jgi:hypothetical protein
VDKDKTGDWEMLQDGEGLVPDLARCCHSVGVGRRAGEDRDKAPSAELGGAAKPVYSA